ncbi:hypothetical protein WAK64_19480 [Bacillus spongiae]|uniref:Uncharacterized protein n=1 Tax=Bacillus spongiae TaxID=2683610 RepID=A0ABU8HJ97_9BACI
MMGIIIREEEKKEIQFLLRREMDEIILDMDDERIDGVVKRAMQERYKILLSLFKRVASTQAEIMKYIVIPKGKKSSSLEFKQNEKFF